MGDNELRMSQEWAENCTHPGTVTRNKGLHATQARLSLENNIEFMPGDAEIPGLKCVP